MSHQHLTGQAQCRYGLRAAYSWEVFQELVQ
jgi:hypothetical protein